MIAASLGFGKVQPTTATMGALLARKQEVSSQLKGQRADLRPQPGATGWCPCASEGADWQKFELGGDFGAKI